MKRARSTTRSLADVTRELAEVARVGQTFIDGDLCRKALQPHAETFMTGDDMDFNPETCVPLKKTLMRLERLSRVPCSTALWRRRPDFPDCGEALMFGAIGSPLGSDKPANRGYRPPPMAQELKAVFLRGGCAQKLSRNLPGTEQMVRHGVGTPVRGVRRDTVVELFVPVTDSMGEVAAALEVFTVATARSA